MVVSHVVVSTDDADGCDPACLESFELGCRFIAMHDIFQALGFERGNDAGRPCRTTARGTVRDGNRPDDRFTVGGKDPRLPQDKVAGDSGYPPRDTHLCGFIQPGFRFRVRRRPDPEESNFPQRPSLWNSQGTDVTGILLAGILHLL